MQIGLEEAGNIKQAADELHTSLHGQLLLEYLWDQAGFYCPTYDSTNQTSVNLAAGRTEMMMIIRNLHRLTPEQIVEETRKE